MSRKHGWLREGLALLAFIAAVGATRSSVADHYFVPTGSMIPTVEVGDRVMVNKLAYGMRVPFSDKLLVPWGRPRAGDVVVLSSPEDGVTLLKRVVAVPGDLVEVHQGQLWINGKPVPIEDDGRGLREALGQGGHPLQLTRGGAHETSSSDAKPAFGAARGNAPPTDALAHEHVDAPSNVTPESAPVAASNPETAAAHTLEAALTPSVVAPASSAPAATTSPSSHATPNAPFEAHLAAALGSPEFAPALGSQLTVFARDGVQQAQLHLNPAEMGPIAVQIDVIDARVHVEFSAEQAATRSAIESSLPELASALRESGLTLAGGGVFQQPRGQREAAAFAAAARRGGARSRDDGATDAVAPAHTPARRGVVDLYA